MIKSTLKHRLMTILMLAIALSTIISCEKPDMSPESAVQVGGRTDIPYNENSYSWDETTKTLIFINSGTFTNFYFDVPNDIETILIKQNVTITGAFNINHDITIEGENWDTSIIYGTNEQRYCQNNGLNPWEHNAIGVYSNAIVHINNLQVRNPRGYCISGYEPESIIHIYKVKMIDDRGGDQNNSDGFIGANGSTIKNCYFDLGDDAIKLYRDMTIENVEIHMQHNGAPIQLGWNDNNNTNVTADIKDLNITGDEESYNLAVISWVNENNTKMMDIDIDGCYIEVPNAQLFKISPALGKAMFDIENANISVAMYGIVNSVNRIRINGSTETANYYSYNGLIPKPEVKEREASEYQAEAMRGTPIVDGEIDDIWSSAPSIITNKVRLGEKETNASYQMMWDDEFFYMLAIVDEENPLNSENPKIWNKDSIELFLDDNNEKTAAYQLDDRHTIFSYDGEMERFDVVKLDRVEAVATVTDTGYYIELKVPFYSPHTVGDVLGFDVQTNSTAGTDSRVSITGWSGTQDLSDKKPEVWGEITLIK